MPNDVVVPGALAAYPPPVPLIERAEAAPIPATTVAALDTARISLPPAVRVPTPNEVVVPGTAPVFPPPIATIERLLEPAVAAPVAFAAQPAAPASMAPAPGADAARDTTVASLDRTMPVPMALPEHRPETPDRAPPLTADITCSPSTEKLASFSNA